MGVRFGYAIAGLCAAAFVPQLAFAQILGWNAPESVAKVTALTGQVSVMKDSTPWALSLGSEIQLKQTIVTGSDGFAVFQVSDGSTFEIYPNSRVTFRNNPGNWKDLIDLWVGRAKIHIEKIGGKPNHNRITTPTAVISVRGTTFDVEVEDSDSTLVAVEEGVVWVQHAIIPVGDPKILNAGESLRVYKNQPLAARGVDKAPLINQALRAASEALYRIVYRTPSTGTGGTPGPVACRPSCDTPSTPPPPPPASSGGGEGSSTPPPPPPQ